MALNLGLSGQPFAGPDIGGFNGNGDEALFERWIGFGALLPFARGHTGKGNINKEPWAYTENVEATARKALQLRYRLLPYYYTLFHEAHRTGLPVARPVFFADPKDPALRTEDDAFLLGADVLVVPNLTPSADRVHALPKGVWREVDLVAAADSIHIPKLRVRAGAIVPVGPVIEYVDQPSSEPLTLLVSLDDAGTATGTLYDDAGDGWGYQSGDFLLTTYTAKREGARVRVSVTTTEGQRKRPARDLRVMILRDGAAPLTADGRDGEPIEVMVGEK
jgi:alpha-glucosidase